MFQIRSQHAKWSLVLQYEEKTWLFHAVWDIIDTRRNQNINRALESGHQSAGSQQLERFLATVRQIIMYPTLAYPMMGIKRWGKRWRLTWWRWQVELRSRHTTVPRSSISLTHPLKTNIIHWHWTPSHGPAPVGSSTRGVCSTSFRDQIYVL